MPSPPISPSAGDSPDQPARHQTGLITIVFTDLVGSTALKQQVGDRAAASLIQQHHGLVRELLRGFEGGEEIETAGDSFLIVFTKPSDAVHFGLLLHARLRAINQGATAWLEDRIGIHVGEVVIREQDGSLNPKGLTGIQVDTCARVMDLAKGGQILLTRSAFDNARQMLKGEDMTGVGSLEWLNHGLYLLKGIESSLEVCEVGEVGVAPLHAPAGSEKAQRQVTADSEAVLGWRPAVGQLVPSTRWRLETKLGEGGFGEVWLGRHQNTKEQRVFKFCFQAERVRFLKREMTLFRLLKERVGDHPHIVRLIDVKLDQPPFYVEMDFVEGADLRSWSAEHGGGEAIPLATRLEIVAQAADGLQAAHEAGIIHRDIKPANILIGGKGIEPAGVRVKLTDFGIGQVVSEEYLSGITRAGFTQTVMTDSSSSHTGTQLYMAPELLAGKPASTRSDIYSLGVVLYQLLAADFSLPVTTDWTNEISDPLLRDDLKHCFAGNPQDRFAGAGQLAKHLRALPERRAALERQQAEKAALERAAYRRGIVRTAAGAVLIVAAVVLLALYAFKQAALARISQQAEQQLRIEAQAQTLAARQRAYASDMNVAKQALDADNFGHTLDLLNRQRPGPDQRDLRGWEWRYLWQQSRSDASFTLCQESAEVSSLAVSPDGLSLAIGSHRQGGLSVWDLRTRQEVAHLAKHESLVRAAFSPTEPLLAFTYWTNTSSGNGGSALHLWNTATRQMVAEFPLGLADCMGLAFAKDGRTLVTSAARLESPGDITLWHMPDGTKLASYPTDQSGMDPATCFAVTPDLSLAAHAHPFQRVAVVDLSNGRELWSAVAAKAYVTALAFSPDGKTLASGAGFAESEIRLWDVATGKQIGLLEGHTLWVSSLVFSRDGRKLISSSADQTIRVWDVASRQCVDVLRGHRQEVWRLALLPDDKTLISGAKDGAVCFWDTSITHPRQRGIVIPGSAVTWCFASDSRSVLTLDYTGRVSRWSGDAFDRQEPLLELGPIPDNSRDHYRFSNGGRILAGCSFNRVVQIWDLSRRAAVHQWTTTTGFARMMAFLADENQLITYDDDNSFRERDSATGRELQSWKAPADFNGAFGVSADERYCAAVGYGRDSILINLADKSRTKVDLDVLEAGCARYSPDGSLLAVASDLGYARMWETATWRHVATVTGFLLGAHSLAFSPDGKRLAIGSGGKEAVKLCDTDSWQDVITLDGQGNDDYDSAFSPDGNLFGWASTSGLHLWRAPSWDQINAAEAGVKAESGQP